MSATLRFDVSEKVHAAILTTCPALIGELGWEPVTRWAGLGRGGWTSHTSSFAIKLPRQAREAMELIQCLSWGPASKSKPSQTLVAKLRLALGFPDGFDPVTPNSFADTMEDCFVEAVKAEPGNLTHWAAYADWLQEQQDPSQQRRGRLIAGWLAPKPALKVRYGIPVIAREETERLYGGKRCY